MALYIPTFIANESFTPAKVNPRMFFYNGLKVNTPGFKFGGWTSDIGDSSNYQNYTSFPYFDHYQGNTDPTSDSESLLFFNEPTAYGQIPSDTLYTKYWEKYIQLLYNPKTRFVECEAQIPFGEYIRLELNDVVIFKGTHYHLRAINDYNLKSGDCKLQLLGPIISDTLT
jgi:hypothetical protein